MVSLLDRLQRYSCFSAPRYAVAGALFQLFCCSFSGLFSILATCPNFGEQFKHIPPVAAFSISPKCTDAFYSRSRSYSVSMSFPAPLSLYHYFVVAARMQHHFESNLVAVEESGVAALQDPDLAAFELFSGPRGNFLYYWYASLCVVVQGFRNLKLVDPRVDALLASPNVKALRRCWNGVFHFQPDYFSAKLLEPMQAPDFIGWVRELMEAFRAYFAREIKPIES